MSLPQREEKRKSPRFSFREAVSYQLYQTPQKFGGCLAYDIGEGGAKINFQDFIPLGTEVTLQVRLGQKSTSRMIDIVGRVVWVIRIPFSDYYQVGVKFIDSIPNLKPKEGIGQYLKAYGALENVSLD